MCGQAFTSPLGNVQVNTSTKGRTCMGKSTGQLQGIIGNCAGVMAQGMGFLRTNVQVGVREQGFTRVSPQVKVGM